MQRIKWKYKYVSVTLKGFVPALHLKYSQCSTPSFLVYWERGYRNSRSLQMKRRKRKRNASPFEIYSTNFTRSLLLHVLIKAKILQLYYYEKLLINTKPLVFMKLKQPVDVFYATVTPIFITCHMFVVPTNAELNLNFYTYPGFSRFACL